MIPVHVYSNTPDILLSCRRVILQGRQCQSFLYHWKFEVLFEWSVRWLRIDKYYTAYYTAVF